MKEKKVFGRFVRRFVALSCLMAVCVCMLTGCLHEHDYDDWEVEKEASCTEKGRKVRTCECGDEETESIPKLDHDYEEETTKLPGCDGAGEVTFTCKNCGDHYKQELTVKEYTATEIYEMYKDSVGEIVTYDRRGGGLALGTGFVAVESNRVYTNFHVIEGAYTAEITFGDDTYDVEKVLTYDKDMDIAVLEIDADLEPVPICKKDHVVGAPVYALGNSRGLTSTFSDGMITAAVREVEGVKHVQHDAPISGGNSGGPLFNVYGEVVGINTWVVQDSQNLNFAVHPSELDNLSFGKALTMKEFYEKECSVYGKIVNYVVTEGKLDDGTYSLVMGTDNEYDCEWGADYDPEEENELWLYYIFGGEMCVFLILTPELDGDYVWAYVDDFENSMAGPIKAATFKDDTVLSYTESDIAQGNDREEVLTVASLMMTLLCDELDDDFKSLNITAEDLGFVYF